MLPFAVMLIIQEYKIYIMDVSVKRVLIISSIIVLVWESYDVLLTLSSFKKNKS